MVLTWPLDLWVLGPFSPEKSQNTANSNCIFYWKLRRDTALIFRYLDSTMDKFFPEKYLIFFDFGLLQGVNLARTWTKKANFEYVLPSEKMELFKMRHMGLRYLWGLAVSKFKPKWTIITRAIAPKLPKLGPIDGLHLFWFRKLARMRLNLAGKKQGKRKSCQIKRSYSDGKSLGRARILFKFKKWR